MAKTVEEYLAALKKELTGSDQATIQDALSDAEEHLRMAVASMRDNKPDLSEEAALQTAIDQYGSPAETAAAYVEIERRTPSGLSRESGKPGPIIGRFFGVYADPRAWGAILYMLIALVTGTLYFTWAVAGLMFSVSFSIFIFGLPFALLFLLSIRGLALLEGRIVEALLGVRMPRRPLFGHPGMKWFERMKLLVTDKYSWLAILYMLLQMPLGTLYFSLLTTLFVFSLSLIATPVIQVVLKIPTVTIGYTGYFLPLWALVLIALGGILVATLTMHLARGIGWLHGRYAKTLLVTE